MAFDFIELIQMMLKGAKKVEGVVVINGEECTFVAFWKGKVIRIDVLTDGSDTQVKQEDD